MSDAPVTKRDLDQAMGELRGEMGELRGELRGEMAELRGELRGEMSELRGEMAELRGEMAGLRGEMATMKTDLIREIGQVASQVANVMMEHIQTLISVVDEKYQDLPPHHAKLRVDFDAHTADRRLHTRPPTTSPKRTRRPPR